MKNILKIFVLALILSACSDQKKSANFEVVCTTNVIGDAANNMLPDSMEGKPVSISTIMGPGVDPHLYKSKSSDNKLLRNADLILYNGLHLEGKLASTIHEISKSKPAIALGEEVDNTKLTATSEFGGSYDPHYWFNVDLYRSSVENSLNKLKSNFKTLNTAKGTNYLAQLAKLDSQTMETCSVLPDSQRVLITAHDAFGYFGKRYGFTVKGVQGVSTASESGIRKITELVDFIISNNIKAIFIESSVSQRNINSIIEGCKSKNHDLKLGGTLYSDALGDKASGAETYIKMIRHNTQTIVEALK